MDEPPDEGSGGTDPPDKSNTNNLNRNRQNNYYKIDDTGPFIVTIQGKNDKKLHPMCIAKDISLLHLKNTCGPLKKGKNSVNITFKDFQSANTFLSCEKLLSKGYDIFIPTYNVTCKGLVRDIPKEYSVDDLLANSRVENMQNKISIRFIKRFNKRITIDNEIKYVPTGTCLFTFEGKIIPRSILIYDLEMLVDPYILPVTQCYSCLRYGHTAKNCKGRKVCKTCGHKTDQDPCEGPCNHCSGACSKSCIHCDSKDHESISKVCPEYFRQQQIRIHMSLDNMSFFQANELIPKIKNSRNKSYIYQG